MRGKSYPSYQHLDDEPYEDEEELRRNLEMKIMELSALRAKLAEAERSIEIKSKISKYLMILGASLIALSCIEEFSFFLAVGLAAFASSFLPYLSKTEPPSRIEGEIRLLMNEIKSIEQMIRKVDQLDEGTRPGMGTREESFEQKG